MTDSLIGKVVDGQFRILEKIGAGGMGAVYKAEQTGMNRLVAIKVLHAKFSTRADVVARFRREARAMSQLSHPNTARVYLYGQLPDRSFYFVMEYMEGQNLAQVVRSQGPMEPTRALNLMIQVCGALEEAHRIGIIHRDLKPENIFLCMQGGIPDVPKVLDFGLAKVSQRQMRADSLILTKQGMVFGTPEFMSPEQAQGKTIDARADIYSLGMMLYELLTGRLPFDAKTAVDYMRAQVTGTPIPLDQRVADKGFAPGLEAAVMKALEKDPEHRYDSAADFAEALKMVLPGRLTTAAMRAVPSDPAPAPAALVVRSMSEASVTPVLKSQVPLLIVGIFFGVCLAAAVALLVAAVR